MKLRLTLTAPIICALAACAPAAPGGAPGVDSIRSEDLKTDLTFLASGALEGRRTGEPGNLAAAEFVRMRFARLGLQPAGPDGSYFQPYDLATASLGEGNTLTAADSRGRRGALRQGVDFYPHRFSATAEAEGPVVFAGFGITSPERQHDDLGGDLVRGAMVLVLDHEPGEMDPDSPFDGIIRAEAANPLQKALFAQARGAAGLLVVRDVHNHEGDENFAQAAAGYWPEAGSRPRYTLRTWMDRVTIPVVQVSVAAADALAVSAGTTLAELAAASETRGGVTPKALGDVRIALKTSLIREYAPDRNVLAYIEGSDPALRDELVIVCGHYDHTGTSGDRIFFGADDNGSGTVAVLEIAEAYAAAAAAGRRPRRSVLFAAWNAEEIGLLGAWAYTEAPFGPLDRTIGVLNMDMIGRNEEVPEGQGNSGRFRGLDEQTAASNANAVNVIGSTRSPALKAATEAANAATGLELKFRYDNNASSLMRRSDHWPFLQRGVPALWFHTGLHPDYHTERDTVDGIEWDKMTRIVKLVHQMSWDLAER